MIWKTSNGGTSWTSEYNPAFLGDLLNSISCTSATSCVAIENNRNITRTTDGVNWTSPLCGGTCQFLSQVSCPSASVCYVSASTAPGQVLSSSDGGATWALSFDAATDPFAAGGRGFSAIDCPSTYACYAVGTGSAPPGPAGVYATTTNGGVTWRTESGPASTSINGMSCPTTSTCYVAATDASIFHTADFGGTWDIQLGSTNTWYWSISCPSTTVCFAGGSGFAGGMTSVTTTAGAAWSMSQPAGSTNPILGLS